MDHLQQYRNSASEKERVDDLMTLLPNGLGTALDVGARDGFLSRLLADRIGSVTALDLEQPSIADERIRCVKGDATALQFPDRSFDVVLCAEVLEHIPPNLLPLACAELARVSNRHILIGVPYRQDTRLGRTTCGACGGENPPWGHVNSFDEKKLFSLFPGCKAARQTFVGTAEMGTNAVSALLMDFAGNPYGTYDQDESCVHCGAALGTARARNLAQKIATKLAEYGRMAQRPFHAVHANWIHILFERPAA